MGEEEVMPHQGGAVLSFRTDIFCPLFLLPLNRGEEKAMTPSSFSALLVVRAVPSILPLPSSQLEVM